MLPTAWEDSEIYRVYKEHSVCIVPNYIETVSIYNYIRPYLSRAPAKGILNLDYIPEINLNTKVEPILKLMSSFGMSPHKP